MPGLSRRQCTVHFSVPCVFFSSTSSTWPIPAIATTVAVPITPTLDTTVFNSSFTMSGVSVCFSGAVFCRETAGQLAWAVRITATRSSSSPRSLAFTLTRRHGSRRSAKNGSSNKQVCVLTPLNSMICSHLRGMCVPYAKLDTMLYVYDLVFQPMVSL